MKPITWEQITGPSRKARVVQKRNSIARDLRNRFQGMTLNDIGHILGGRSPATIMHAISHSYSTREDMRQYNRIIPPAPLTK